MSVEAVLHELNEIRQAGTGKPYCQRAHLTADHVQKWSASLCQSEAHLYDQIGIYLARGFHSRELDFEFCDAVVNDIYGLIVSSPDPDLPDLFYEVHSAFDEGEFWHKGQPEENDPVEIYTRPLIAGIVEKSSASGEGLLSQNR
jgi:hypothetical protein